MKGRWRWFLVFSCLWFSGTFIMTMFTFPDSKRKFQNEFGNTVMGKHSNTTLSTYLDGIISVIDKHPSTNITLHQRQRDVQPLNRYESEKLYFTPNSYKVNRMDAEFVIANRRFCEKVVPYILVIVPSVHRNAEVRHAIRNSYGSKTLWTYGRNSNVTVKLLFLFGRGTHQFDEDILRESRKYKDIVQVDFIDSYRNLTRKILYGLKWASIYCSEVEFVAKVDEDVFVNIPVLIDYLQKTPYPMSGAVYGHIYHHSSVRRSGKWAVMKHEYPLQNYPTYASGNSYVISGNIIPRLFALSEFMPYLPIEDAFITGCLAKIIRAEHIHNNRFTQWLSPKPDPCTFLKENKISATKVTISLFFKLWEATQSQLTCS